MSSFNDFSACCKPYYILINMPEKKFTDSKDKLTDQLGTLFRVALSNWNVNTLFTFCRAKD